MSVPNSGGGVAWSLFEYVAVAHRRRRGLKDLCLLVLMDGLLICRSVDLSKLDEFALLKPLSDSYLEWNPSASEGEEEEEDEDERGEEDEGEEGEEVEGGEEAEEEVDEQEDDEEQKEKAGLRQRRRKVLERKLVTEDDAWTPRVGETLKVREGHHDGVERDSLA